MDQDLKQRLVGAVVITALAAIFVPMFFDDPVDESGKMISELKIPDEPVLSQEYNVESISSHVDDVELPKSLPLKEEKLVHKNVATLGSWFVQVGIFVNEGNAYTFRDKIRSQGFPVTVATISSKNGMLYRVRVGPELDKKRAEKMKKKIEKKNGLKGILISATD
ncbi:MAG: SPOR domain-containing protein [Methylococcales bacterium]|nr:SPOR domain-containing protein [Methylococcales bacterium]